MKIVYFGKFVAPYSTENYVTYALRELGVDVVQVEATALGTHYNVSALTRILEREAPNILLMSKPETTDAVHLLQWCKDNGIATVTWVWDLYWGYRSPIPHHFASDLLLTTDGGHDKEWAKWGANHKVLRQGIHEPEYYSRPAKGAAYDVAFIGGEIGHPSRMELLRYLRRNYTGRFVHAQDIRGHALNNLLAVTRIVVGDSYPSPYYWSNRIYEITGRGGMILHPHTYGLEAEYEAGKDYVPYERGDFAALDERIRYYLQHEGERERIRESGHSRAGAYTYTARVETLIGHMAELLGTGAGDAVADDPTALEGHNLYHGPKVRVKTWDEVIGMGSSPISEPDPPTAAPNATEGDPA